MTGKNETGLLEDGENVKTIIVFALTVQEKSKFGDAVVEVYDIRGVMETDSGLMTCE